MRRIGAGARAMLVATAADAWSVPQDEIEVLSGVLRHTASGRESRFGPFAQAAMRQPVPDPDSLQLRDRKDWTLIGRSLPRVDTKAKTDGTAIYAIDVRRPEMLRAVIARPPRFGGRLLSVEEDAALAVPGVKEVLRIPAGVAVLAEDSWAAMQGRAALVTMWDDSAAETRSSAEILADYKKIADEPGVMALDRGDAETGLNGAAHRIDYEFDFPYLAHAPMEPLTCVMERTEDGVTVWAGCQAHTLEQAAVARALGIEPDQVRIETTWAGASIGRRTNPRTDWIPELAQIVASSKLNRPVQLLWTREDDLAGGAYRPLAYHRGSVGVDKKGRISGWAHRVVCQSLVVGTPWSYKRAEAGIDRASVGGMVEAAYNLPDYRVDVHSPTSPVPVSFWRSVGDGHNAFVLETIMDELAYLVGQDPLAFRLAHLDGDRRQRAVLETAAARAGWGAPLPPGRGRGLSCFFDGIYGLRSYIAMVAEVSDSDGVLKVEKVVAAVDCGLIINPDIVVSQIEGAIAFALPTALRNAITLDAGRVEQSNFHEFEPARFSEMPTIEVELVDSDAPPSGVGEVGVAPLAPAIGNALFAATGKRARRLPLSNAGV